MLDIKLVRSNPDLVKAGMAKRGKNMDKYIDDIIDIDNQRREISREVEAMKAEQNRVSKLVPQMKKEGKDTTELFAEMKELSAKIKEADDRLSVLEEKQRMDLLNIPNRCLRASMTRRTRRYAAGASRESLISPRKPIGTSARIWTFWTPKEPQRSPARAFTSIKDWAPAWSVPSSTSIWIRTLPTDIRKCFRRSWSTVRP